MKYGLFILFFIGQIASAQTLREQRIKTEMLERVDTLISKMDSAREDLAKQDVQSACEKVKEIFKIYPDHILAIGTNMNLFSRKTIRIAKDRSLPQLIYFHKQTLICDRGTECEYVDSKKLSKELRKISRSLKKQHRIIRKGDTGYSNDFSYNYKF